MENKNKTLLCFKKLIFNLSLISMLISQNFSIRGHLWYSGLISNDVPKNYSPIESKIGTISTFSIFKEFPNNQLLDFEYAHKIDHTYSGDSIISEEKVGLKFFNTNLNYKNTFGEPYRFWIRYSTNKLETRLGLQKIIFGPTQILRNLSWFDNVDLTDPIGQIDGVEAFRLKWFPSNSISLWSWYMLDDSSFGFRSELSHSSGEWGIAYHTDQKDNIGLDYRYDGYLGLWSESSLSSSENIKQIMTTLGLDYTLPIGNGLYLMTEFMSVQKEKPIESKENYVAILANMPIGMIHQISVIKQVSIKENKNYNFLRWSSTYDNFSLNYIFSINPKRDDYLPIKVPNILENFGSTFQIMFIYNY